MKVQKNHLYIGAGIAFVALVVLTSWTFRKEEEKEVSIDTSIFDSPDQPGSGKCIDPTLVKMLRALEKETGYPVLKNINSGVRTVKRNASAGGVKNSAHIITRCKGVDIGIRNAALKKKLVYAAKRIGFKRIGIANTFVHLDVDETKRQYVAWGYPKGKKPPYNPFIN